MSAIYYVSSIPGHELGSTVAARFPDKVMHALGFAGLCLTFYLACTISFGMTSKAAGWTSFGLSVAYGIADEIHQGFVPGRDPSVGDVIADAVGAALAVAAISISRRAGKPVNRKAS